VISLTDDPENVYIVVCDRGERALMVRNDDADNREAVIWVAPAPDVNESLDIAREWLREASVALSKPTLVSLADTLFEIAARLDDPDLGDFSTNGHHPV